MDEAKKHRQLAIGLLSGTAVLLVAVVLINYFYLSDTVQLAESSAAALNNKLLSDQNAFKQIQEKLATDDQFNALQKFGTWPLRLEDLKPGKTNPFIEPLTK